MILTTHALAGAVIGKNIDNLTLIAVISVATHYAMDILKHGDYYEEKRSLFQGFKKEVIDLSIAALLIIFIIYFDKSGKQEIFRMLWGIGWSLLPDLTTLIYDKFNIRPVLGKLYKFNYWIHHLFYTDSDRQWTPKNLINDLIISFLAIIALLLF